MFMRSLTIWLMKRLLFPTLLALMLGLTTAPVTLPVVSVNVAQAADCPDGTIKVGVPIEKGKECIENNAASGGAIAVYLRMVLKFLSGGIGLVIVLMMVIAGIQYITSTGDPARVKAAKDRIVNAITALVLFVMAFAILSFIIPGGIL